ncbi:transcriptional regulator, partial [Bifidobacterium longum subsp. infantis]
MSVMDLTNAVLDLLPSMPSGVKIYRQEEPLESEMPPWIIARVSTDRHVEA